MIPPFFWLFYIYLWHACNIECGNYFILVTCFCLFIADVGCCSSSFASRYGNLLELRPTVWLASETSPSMSRGRLCASRTPVGLMYWFVDIKPIEPFDKYLLDICLTNKIMGLTYLHHMEMDIACTSLIDQIQSSSEITEWKLLK